MVFDFGGVFTPSPFDAMVTLGDRLGIEPSAAMAHVFGPYDRDTDHPWHQAERGELDIQATRDAILELAPAEGLEIDLFEVFGHDGRQRRRRPRRRWSSAPAGCGSRATAPR